MPPSITFQNLASDIQCQQCWLSDQPGSPCSQSPLELIGQEVWWRYSSLGCCYLGQQERVCVCLDQPPSSLLDWPGLFIQSHYHQSSCILVFPVQMATM